MISKQHIVRFMNELDEDFSPKLSDSVDIDLYVEKLLLFSNFVCEFDRNRISALAAFYVNSSEKASAYLSYIGVTKGFRSSGVASRLLLLVESSSKSLGYSALRLEVYKTNSKAISFYCKNLYEVESESSSSFVFRKTL